MTEDELRRVSHRRSVAAHRKRYPEAADRAVRKVKAYRRALAELGDRHPEELAELRAVEERKLGL